MRPAIYLTTKNSLHITFKASLNETSAVAIITDFWTVQANEALWSLTGHWLEISEMQSAVLQCINIHEHHTGNQVADLLLHFADEWSITTKLQAIVTDNARNMVSGVCGGSNRFS